MSDIYLARKERSIVNSFHLAKEPLSFAIKLSSLQAGRAGNQ